jgi:hypothetical protein
MSRYWPRWRYEKESDEVEAVEASKRVEEAKSEAIEALHESYGQLEQVRQLSQEHRPVRSSLRRIREANGFTETMRRVIEEGR